MKTFGPLGMLLVLCACNKVPIIDIHAGFALADATWFEDEQTLFIFYKVNAEQGLGPDSQIEVTWRTDDVEVPWTAVETLTPIHTHIPVDCGPHTMCGSTSLKIQRVPRLVGVRLRYHKEGSVFLTAPVTYNIIGTGPAFTHRSLIVYGVFERANNTVQWRARHQFPTLRNEDVQGLGLLRDFRITDPRYGSVVAPMGNPYGYASAATCPTTLTALSWGPVATNGRAIFDVNKLPLEASTAPGICAQSVVTDAKGTFEAVAIARKNPDVHPAFPVLRTPIRANTEVGFLLRPCMREISKVHLSMQVQRLMLEGAPEICIDDFKNPAFADSLAARLRLKIDEVRAAGKDMVLTLALHHDDSKGELGLAVEKALEQILPFERDKTSPRVSGAFVFDSLKYAIVSPTMRSLVLWCPASIDAVDLDKIPDEAQRSCPLVPDFPDLKLGPFKFSNLPILPSRPQYLTFIAKYSEAQAGKMLELGFLAPERTPISQNVQLGEFGVASFFNNERLTAAPTDAFSFCAGGDPLSSNVVFRSASFPAPQPISSLPEFHKFAPASAYEIGLFWNFPFLLKAKYEFVVAGAATAFSVTVPFGITDVAHKNYASELWTAAEFPVAKTLGQCTRYCDHPTFDTGGVYNVAATYREAFAAQCYDPLYPTPADGPFPRDP